METLLILPVTGVIGLVVLLAGMFLLVSADRFMAHVRVRDFFELRDPALVQPPSVWL